MSIVLVGMVAFCVDLGYVLSAKEELQRSADSSALAACWEFGKQLSSGSSLATACRLRPDHGRPVRRTEQRHWPCHVARIPTRATVRSGDVVLGYMADFKNSQSAFQTDGANGYNAVKVRLRKDSSINGKVPFFFARVFGLTDKTFSRKPLPD